MHKGIAKKVDEHNLTIAEKPDIFRWDHHFRMFGRTYQQTYDRKLTIPAPLGL